MKTFSKLWGWHLLLITLLNSSFCYSQKLAVGIKAGRSSSNSSVSNITSYPPNLPQTKSARSGILFGMYVDIKGGKKLMFRPGIELVPKGLMINNYAFRYSYVDFPLNTLYKMNNSKGALLIGGGPTIGIPLNSYRGFFYGPYKLKTDFGLNGLIGFEFPIGFSMNLNYTYGLINAGFQEQSGSTIRNRYLGITAGYTF